MMMGTAIFAPMTDLREQQLAWLENIVASSGMTITDIARRAKLDPSTLTRFRNKNEGGHALTARTVKKIEEATGVPAYEQRLRPKLSYYSEEEGVPYRFDDGVQDLLINALRTTVSGNNSVDLWVLKSHVLAAVGYNEGDVVVVDREAIPRPGDAVIAQKYDYRRGVAETIFRVYRTPYLLTALAHGEPGQPEIVDEENVVIKGVVVGGCRLRA
jgi:transcriptional regulator with XRE-family HTH domain